MSYEVIAYADKNGHWWREPGVPITAVLRANGQVINVPGVITENPAGKPKPVEFTTKECGEWMAWDEEVTARRGLAIHSVKFSDGAIFDATNGWR